MDIHIKSKIDSLNLNWYTKTTKLLAFDFQLKDYENLKQFVNELFILFQSENYYPDILIHKHNNVRVELYNKEIGGIQPKEAEIAGRIESIYQDKYS